MFYYTRVLHVHLILKIFAFFFSKNVRQQLTNEQVINAPRFAGERNPRQANPEEEQKKI